MLLTEGLRRFVRSWSTSTRQFQKTWILNARHEVGELELLAELDGKIGVIPVKEEQRCQQTCRAPD